jgi:D-glycero-D-manno-heptose 1,7-bisphosphate phosphatase
MEEGKMNQAIFLDRDGVINEVLTSRVKFVNKPQQLYLLEGAAEAIAAFTDAGYDVYVVTNQGGVGLGYLKERELQRIHQRLHELVEEKGGKVREISYCPHKPKAGCECRKPNAGQKAGCKTVFIGSEETVADIQANTLFEAVNPILSLLAE